MVKATFWERLAFSSSKDAFQAAKRTGCPPGLRPEDEAAPGLAGSRGTA